MRDDDLGPNLVGSQTVTADGTPASDVDGDERDRLRREVADLRRDNARLGLELQVERERFRHLEERLEAGSTADGVGPDQQPAGVSGAGRLVLPSPEDIRNSATRVLGAWSARLRAATAPREERAPAAAWSRLAAWEIAVAALILGVAVVARYYDLTELPRGLQGDEATAGLLGRRVLDEGWIGPFTTLMAGAPTGFYYAVGVAMAVVPDEILAIRGTSALFGTLTVVALYVLIRRSFGAPAALAGAAFLAALGWHIHFSRLGFPLSVWPLTVVLAILALVEAVRTADWRWWTAAGACFGLGLLTYSSHVLLLGVVAPVIALHLFGLPAIGVGAAVALYAARPGFLALALLAAALTWLLASQRLKDRRRLAAALAFAGAFVAAGFVMLRYIAVDRNDYFARGRGISIFRSEEWDAKDGRAEQVGFLAARYGDYWDRLCCHPHVDYVEATGVTPVVPLPLVLLAAVGLGFALRRRGRMAAWLGALVVLLMPLASALTTDFALRRSLVGGVFLAMFAGIGAVEGTRWAWSRRPAFGVPAFVLVALLSTVGVYRSLDDYFGTALDSQEMHWTLAVQMVEAGEYLATLPEDSYVYFYSDRWPWDYEIRRFFAPDARGESRSEQFGTYGFAINPAGGQPVFLFLGSYRGDLATAQALYPGGETIVGGDPADPDYLVYLPPAGVPSTVPPPTAPAATPAGTPTFPPEGRGSRR